MFVPKSRYLAAFASLLMGLASLSDSARAQSVRDAMNQRNARQRVGANAVPLRSFPGVGDTRFLPSDVTRRSLTGVPGFSDTKGSGKTRVQIGGPNGANVQEQVVNVTNSALTDQLTPFWTNDEQFLYYASRPSGSGYQLRRVATGAVNNPLLPGNAVDTAVSNEAAADHLFPAIDGSGNRIAFVKSYDGLATTNPAKLWDLYVSVNPSSGGTIDPNPGGATNLLAITTGRSFGVGGAKSFNSVGRVAWLGATTLVFSARLTGEAQFHLFQVDLVGFNFQQLTTGLASEENPTISPDGRWIAFDSNAVPTVGGVSYVGGTAPATNFSNGDPARASVAPGTVRNIFVMPSSGVGVPQQFTGRFTGAPAVSNVHPAWSSSRTNVFTNAGGATQYLAFSSTRQISGSSVVSGSTKDIYIAPVTTNNAQAILSESSATAAVQVDVADSAFAFDDEYPAWSPIIALTRIAMQSNRTGNLLVNSYPATGFSATPGVRDLFLASVVDINAPTLIRFDTNATAGEVVHVNLGNSYSAGQSVRTREDGLLPGSTVFFTVRAEDRESGLRADNDPNGGAVYIQIKNPNSLFQAQAQGDPAPREYKEYLTGPRPLFTLVENNDGGVPIERPFAQADGSLAVGREFEAQVLGMDLVTYFRHVGNGGPVYVGGIADAQAFTGSVNPPLDGVRSTANCWLKLNRLPDLPSDGRGGVLYGASMTLPNVSSDWYLDVIMYDRATNPYAPAAGQSNWIIYDNVWGFSTALPLNPQEYDVLFVSDYMLGQKFFRARFGDLPSDVNAVNLQPIRFGAESFYTDSDLSRFPGESPAGAPAPPSPAGATPTPRFYDTTGPFFRNAGSNGASGVRRFNPAGTVLNPSYPSTLGVGSYADETLPHDVVGPLSNGQRYALPQVGRYSIWRILSRGPVPQTLLDAYLPKRTIAPADVEVGETAPRDVRIWNRLVVWGSPFAGNLFVGRGSITDLQTQDALSTFVSNGGRVFISGSDVGFALAGNGQANNFFQNTLQAVWGSDGVPGSVTNVVTPVGGPFRFFTQDPYRSGGPQRAYGQTTDGITWNYSAPTTNVQIAARLASGISNAYFGDGAGTSNFDTTYIDTVTARPTDLANLASAGVFTGVEYTHSGGAGILTSHFALNANAAVPASDPFAVERKFLSGGSVLYSTIGFESISQGWYVYTPSGAQFQNLATLGRRSEIMANFTGAYRSGTIIGRVIDDNGSPVAGALVRAVRGIGQTAIPAWGTAITDASGGFNIIGLPADTYFLFGYSPGYYTQHTGGITIQGTQIARADVKLKRANPGRLQNITPDSTGAVSAGITDASGRGVAGIEIQLRRLNPDGTTSVFKTVSKAADPQTPAGSYTLPDLAIGDYDVYVNWDTTLDTAGSEVAQANNPAYGKIHLTTNPQTGVTVGTGTILVPPTTGTGIRLRILEDITSNLDFQLVGGSQAAVGNVVEDATGNPIAGASVAATDASGTVIASATTGTDGRYQLQTTTTPPSTQIPAGDYTIAASARGYNTATVQQAIGGTGTVTIPALRLAAIPPGGVRGLISGSISNGGLAGVSVRLFFLRSDGTEDPAFQQVTSTASLTATNGIVYNYEFPLGTVPAGDYILRFEKDGLASDPVQIRITVASSAITYVSTSAQMKAPRTFGNGMQLLSIPYDYSGIFPASQPGSIFSLSAAGDNDGDGTANTANDQALYSQFNIADWTGLDYKIGNTIPILVGKGYFIKFGGVTPVSRTGTGVASTTFTLNLTPGWNLIGNPFANRTSASALPPDLDINTDVTVQDGTATPVTMAEAVRLGLVKSSVFAYTGSENNAQYLQTTVLQAWRGYWFRNNTNREIRLNFTYPVGRSVSRFQVAKTITRAEAEAVVPRQFTSTGVQDWRLQIAARQGNLADTDNSIGVSRAAKDGYDNQFDTPKPPALAQAPSVYVALGGVDGAGRSVPFADVIHAPGTKKSWEMSVTPSKNGDVTLYWPNVNRLPREVQPTLIDSVTGRRVSLRSAASFKFSGTAGTTRSFKIEVAAARTAPLALYGTRVTTITGTRGIASGYRFAFNATQEADVQAEVKSLTGRTLRVLQTRAVPGQETSLFWDGKSAQSAPLPAGTYVLTLTAKDEAGNVVRQSLPLTTIR